MNAEILHSLYMGGYAWYVWPAYLSTLFILSGLVVRTWWLGRRIRRDISKMDLV